MDQIDVSTKLYLIERSVNYEYYVMFKEMSEVEQWGRWLRLFLYH